MIAGEPDADAITEQTGVAVDQRVGEGDRIAVGTCSLAVIPVAGHTPGSICLVYDDGSGRPHLFTGDSLFPGGVGNTQGDADRFHQLIGDVSSRSSSTPCPTRPGSTPATATTRPSASSGPTSTSGASAAGDRTSAHRPD